MTFTEIQKQVLREMVKANGNDAYAVQVGADNDFALSELANYKASRLAYLADAQMRLDAMTALYNSI